MLLCFDESLRSSNAACEVEECSKMTLLNIQALLVDGSCKECDNMKSAIK